MAKIIHSQMIMDISWHKAFPFSNLNFVCSQMTIIATSYPLHKNAATLDAFLKYVRKNCLLSIPIGMEYRITGYPILS